ncbi:hypothetical protein CHU98_g4607 [Xylaria longipes]|nr:hypothetical protein CHU98_g4607 [Xylaria longipes]
MPPRVRGFDPEARRPKVPRHARVPGMSDDESDDGFISGHEDTPMEGTEDVLAPEGYIAEPGADDTHAGDDGDVGQTGMLSVEMDDVQLSDVPADDSDSLIDEPDTIINLEELRAGAVKEVEDRTVQPDDNDLFGAINYDEAIDLDIQEPESTSFDAPDDDTLSVPQIHPAGQPAPGRTETLDISVLVPTHQNRFLETSKFEKALAAYADLYGISRDQWASLREILMTVTTGDGDGETPNVIAELPKQLSTLVDRFRKRLPLMDMREATIPLKAEKLPTEARTRRTKLVESLRARIRQMEEGRKGKKNKGKAKQPRQPKQTRDDQDGHEAEAEAEIAPIASTKLTFFDPPTVAKNLVSSDIYTKDMHRGPGEFVDNPSELFHSRAWTSSVRSSNGIYPHLPVSGAVIFPGDFLYYRCTDQGCYCHSIADDGEDTWQLHIGRLVGFGYDMRSDSCTEQSDHLLALQIQPAISSYETVKLGSVVVDPPVDDEELVLDCDLIFIPETSAFAALDVFKDYQFGECQENPSLPKPKPRRGRGKQREDPTFNKYEDIMVPEKTEDQYYHVRRVMRKHKTLDADSLSIVTEKELVSLCHTHPIRGELEIEYFGRYMFETLWDQANPENPPVASLPVETFIDGFGVFSNSYRSLLGYYITPCGLKSKDRQRPGNIIPLVLGPHGSDFSDVVKGLGTLVDLDAGIMTEINGVETRLCMWTMVFIGDMPQQAENCGFKSPRANKFCRGCYIGVGHKSFSDPASNVEFDSVTHGRYHHQVKKMQQSMALHPGGKKETYGSQWGMTNPHPALLTIAPALDIILTRPYDPCHSEYSGLFNLAHFLFRDAILTPSAIDEYTLELRAFTFPPNARRLQSPKHHLSSYEMSAHAIWGTIVPVFLREWLKPDHLKPRFLEVATQYGDPVNVVITAFVHMAKSATVLMGYSASKEDYDNLEVIIRQGRESFNLLCYIASVSAASRAGSRAQSRAGSTIPQPQPQLQSQQGLDLGGVAAGEEGDLAVGMKLMHMNDTQRPNMHIAIHYHDFAAEYAKMVNCNTLTGEDLHRWFKRRVYETNYSNVEKVLLMKLNSQLTIRLLLRNAFNYDDPSLTADMQQLYRECPNLFRRALARTDRNELEILQEQGEFVLDVPPSANDTHFDPSVINKIPTREVRTLSHMAQGPEGGGSLPLLAQNMSTHFIQLLRLAYATDYGFPEHHPSAWDPTAGIKWSRKLAFNTSGEDKDRFVFSQGDFIQYHGGQHGRIDHIFVFNVWGIEHIFAIVTQIEDNGDVDDILKLKLMDEKEDDPIMIGITAIDPVKPYIVPMKGQPKDPMHNTV